MISNILSYISGRSWISTMAYLIIFGELFLSLLLFQSNLVKADETTNLAPEGSLLNLKVNKNPFSMEVLNQRGQPLLKTISPVGYTTVFNQKPYQFLFWWYLTNGRTAPWIYVDTVVNIKKIGNKLEVYLGEKPDGPSLVKITAFLSGKNTLKLNTQVINHPDVNRVEMRFVRSNQDRYYGMGERYWSTEYSGSVLHNWTEEKGGGGAYPKGKDMTYYPVPFFLNPKGYGFLLDDTHPSEFNFNDYDVKSRQNAIKVINYNNSLDFLVFYGPSPLEVIENYTAHAGRITQVPPLWAFAPMNSTINGSARAREVIKKLRDNKIPTSAMWIYDYWYTTRGKASYKVDRNVYPDYEQLIKYFHENGFRYLGYFSPFILTSENSAFTEGDRNGYFTKDRVGKTYKYYLGNQNQEVAQIDLTNPAAQAWWKNRFFDKYVQEYKMDGWMLDFGEYTPPDSFAFDGRGGMELHNQYPVLWAKFARNYFDKARPDGDYLFYVRSGYTGTQKYASVMWAGDANANWEAGDGLPSQIPALLSIGISGHPIGSTDIAGYFCGLLRHQNADKEIYWRWLEFGALLPIMRSHRGDPGCHHWDFDSDAETLTNYKKYAKLHTSLFPYLYTLAYQAKEKGWPIMRHLILHYPNDPGSAKIDDEYLLGDRLLVAPVIQKGARNRMVYFPPGEWEDFWNGNRYQGSGYHDVKSSLEEIPLFQKAGTILPLFDSEIDTLLKVKGKNLKGWDDANASMEVRFAGFGKDQFTLWDGTVLKFQRNPREAGTYSVTHAPLSRHYHPNFL